jgi:copper chaperone NosL
MSTPRLVIVAFALLSSACGARAMGPPELVVDRTACSHCGMFVSEPVYAAAYQAGDNAPRVFDDIGCMLDAVDREAASPVTIWLQDAAGGGWIDVHGAHVVSSARLRTPMGGGFLAYADSAAAQQSAAAHGGRVLKSLHELKASRGGVE